MMTRLLNRCSNEKGMALAMTLMIIVVFLVLGSIFMTRTVNEKNISDREKIWNQAYFIAETGGDAGLAKIDELINTDLLNTINSANPNVFGAAAAQCAQHGDGLQLLNDYVKVSGVNQLTLSGSQLTYTSSTANFGAGSYSYNVIITQKSVPVTVYTDTWDFPYYYQVNATATVSGVSRKVRLDGDFTVRVQRDNFAKFALFTDHQFLPSGDTVWFTGSTNFAGTIHTNDRFNFAYNPSGTFLQPVTQHLTTAQFYNNGFPFLANAENNGAIDVPVFMSGYTRGVDEIVLSSTVQQSDLSDEARGTYHGNSNGIYVPAQAGALTGGIFINGNATITLGTDASDNAQYTITVGGTTKTITVDKTANQTTVVTSGGGGGSTTYSGTPTGVDHLGTIIYVNGTVNGLSGTVQRETQITISAQTDINITGHIRYENYTPGSGTPGTVGYTPPSAAGTNNLLGILAWGGNVNIATTAPNNLEVHGIVMARNGMFQVNNYTDTGVGARGITTLLGGAITQFYGAFGLNNSTTNQVISGYGRNFIYDTRTQFGTAPPYFPSMKNFIAFTNDLTDKVAFQEGGF